MTDFSELRHSAVQRFQAGDPEQLANLVLTGGLNAIERQFLAELVRGHVPSQGRGRPRKSKKPIRAGLIRFWRAEIDGWSKAEAITREIAIALGVSDEMARKYLKQIDRPENTGEAQISATVGFALMERRLMLAGADDAFASELRNSDLKPISAK